MSLQHTLEKEKKEEKKEKRERECIPLHCVAVSVPAQKIRPQRCRIAAPNDERTPGAHIPK
jgi:hypothetical protein